MCVCVGELQLAASMINQLDGKNVTIIFVMMKISECCFFFVCMYMKTLRNVDVGKIFSVILWIPRNIFLLFLMRILHANVGGRTSNVIIWFGKKKYFMK